MAPEGAIISNEAPDKEAYTMVVIKWSEKVEGSGDNIYSPLCGRLYKEKEYSLVPWSGTDADAKMNGFTGPKRTMIRLFQRINMMKNSRTGEDLYIMVDFVHRPSSRKERQKRHAPIMQALPSLMAFLEKEIQK